MSESRFGRIFLNPFFDRGTYDRNGIPVLFWRDIQMIIQYDGFRCCSIFFYLLCSNLMHSVVPWFVAFLHISVLGKSSFSKYQKFLQRDYLFGYYVTDILSLWHLVATNCLYGILFKPTVIRSGNASDLTRFRSGSTYRGGHCCSKGFLDRDRVPHPCTTVCCYLSVLWHYAGVKSCAFMTAFLLTYGLIYSPLIQWRKKKYEPWIKDAPKNLEEVTMGHFIYKDIVNESGPGSEKMSMIFIKRDLNFKTREFENKWTTFQGPNEIKGPDMTPERWNELQKLGNLYGI